MSEAKSGEFSLKESHRISLALNVPSYNSNMNENREPPLIDFDELKQEIVEAIRAAIQERADELGISYEACIDLFFGKQAV
jgi:hypothetical protein